MKKYVYKVTVWDENFNDHQYDEQIFEEYTRTFERAINVCNALSGRAVNYKRICSTMRGVSHGANMQRWKNRHSETRDISECLYYRRAYIERIRVV